MPLCDAAKRPRNDQVDWSKFDSEQYHETNYRSLRADDTALIAITREFFATARKGLPPGPGIDVGSGANLYPAFGMLPFCNSLELWEHSSANVEWLTRQVKDFGPDWDQFWEQYRKNDAYNLSAVEAREALHKRAQVEHRSIFDLPAAGVQLEPWDMGTMFFVACSITADIEEFRRALRQFLGALRPGAPFVAAFMRDSRGYQVGDRWFPAVPVGPAQVAQCVADLVEPMSLMIYEVRASEPLREDVVMMIATGHVRRADRRYRKSGNAAVVCQPDEGMGP